VEGIAYYFVSEAEFKSLIAENAFVEHAFFSGHHYGTSKMTIGNQTAKGLIAVLDIEMHGILQMKADPSFGARYIFIRPPSLQALEERLRNRGTESDCDVEKRLAQARIELEYADSEEAYDKIIVNDDFDKAFDELEGFVYDAA
jgi:guanylate kinase